MWDLIRLLALVSLCRVGYEASQPRPAGSPATCGRKLTEVENSVSLSQEPEARPGDLPPQVQEWRRQELRRYREAQEKKWRNWYGAMFEPKS